MPRWSKALHGMLAGRRLGDSLEILTGRRAADAPLTRHGLWPPTSVSSSSIIVACCCVSTRPRAASARAERGTRASGVSAPAAFDRRMSGPCMRPSGAVPGAEGILQLYRIAWSTWFREGYDMAIRIGDVTDPNYVSVRLYRTAGWCAAPPATSGGWGCRGSPRISPPQLPGLQPAGWPAREWTFGRDGNLSRCGLTAISTAMTGNCYDWVEARSGRRLALSTLIQADSKLRRAGVAILDEYAV